MKRFIISLLAFSILFTVNSIAAKQLRVTGYELRVDSINSSTRNQQLVNSSGKHQLFNEVLNQYVRKGTVNYKSLCKDKRLDRYIDQISKSDPDSLGSEKAKLAFWINAYNAWTLKIICDNYPLKSINQLHTGGLALGMLFKNTIWDKNIITINKQKTSLNNIEHKIMRPVFNDPRIHFAIVCAAKGCPPLRNEAYEAEKLDQQLDDQGGTFLKQEEKNSFNFEKKLASISPIFGWFKEDFGTRPENILNFIADYLPDEKGRILKKKTKEWRIKYTDYDWSINE